MDRNGPQKYREDDGKAVDRLKLAAHAKINLALDILGKRPDGYHEVEMVMQAVGLHDSVELVAKETGVSLECDRMELPCDRTNLAFRAAELLQAECGVRTGVHIALTKRIPLAAGLAGGSSDAAAVLRGLNVLWKLGLSSGDLERLAARLGSDVPFCLWGGTVLATGRGELLAPLPDFAGIGVVLANPPLQVATAWVYGQYSSAASAAAPDIPRMCRAVGDGDFSTVAAALGNRLESVTMPAFPQIGMIKREFVRAGACGVLMSGSGPTVFALTPDGISAAELAGRISLAADVAVFITETVAREVQTNVP